jgi:GT2 family glycosyltransferase
VADPEDPATAVTVAYVHEKLMASSFHHSMINMIGWDLAHEGRIIRGGYKAWTCGTDGLTDSRNKLVAAFLKEHDAHWLLWIDTDMGFAPDTLDRLFAAADPELRPIVGGLCFTQREEESDGMGGWRCRATPTVFDWTVLDDGKTGFSVRWDYPPNALTRCAGTGSACVLIHRSVFERIHAEYGTWYDRVPNPAMGQVISEDLSLCLRAGALNIPVHVHTGVKTTHQKVLWLAEDDYYGQVALSKMVPQVPPATEATAVIVPVLGRPGNAAPFMESLDASGADLAQVYAVADDGDDETALAWIGAGATLIPWLGAVPGTFAQKVNLGYRKTDEPWLLLAGDDVRFHPGWLDQAQAAARDGADVVGTNDLHNPRALAGEWSPHPMIRRAYVDETGGSWDGPGTVAHEGYGHWFVDDEIVTAARQRGAWAMAAHAKIEHLHPIWGLAEEDETYRLGQSHIEADKKLFESRLADHG